MDLGLKRAGKKLQVVCQFPITRLIGRQDGFLLDWPVNVRSRVEEVAE